MKVQRIAVPFASEIILSSKRVGCLLYHRLCLRDRQRMGFDKLDVGHESSATAMWTSIEPGFICNCAAPRMRCTARWGSRLFTVDESRGRRGNRLPQRALWG